MTLSDEIRLPPQETPHTAVKRYGCLSCSSPAAGREYTRALTTGIRGDTCSVLWRKDKL
jgi:hypothetical protein